MSELNAMPPQSSHSCRAAAELLPPPPRCCHAATAAVPLKLPPKLLCCHPRYRPRHRAATVALPPSCQAAVKLPPPPQPLPPPPLRCHSAATATTAVLSLPPSCCHQAAATTATTVPSWCRSTSTAAAQHAPSPLLPNTNVIKHWRLFAGRLAARRGCQKSTH